MGADTKTLQFPRHWNMGKGAGCLTTEIAVFDGKNREMKTPSPKLMAH